MTNLLNVGDKVLVHYISKVRGIEKVSWKYCTILSVSAKWIHTSKGYIPADRIVKVQHSQF